MTERRFRLVICVLVLTAWSGRAAAQGDAFKEGVRARNDRRWDEAASQMRVAIQENGNESSEKVRITGIAFISLNSIEYLPHFFLGEALFSKGDCVGAVSAWEESERQGMIRRRQDFVTVMQRGYAACTQKGVLSSADFQPLMQRAQGALSEAGAARAKVSQRTPEQNAVWRQTASLQEQFERSGDDLETAQSKITSGRRTRAAQDLNDARILAERAEEGFERVHAELEAAVELFSGTQTLLSNLERALASAEDVDRAIDPLLARVPRAALPVAATSARAGAREALGRARSLLVRRESASTTAITDTTRSVQDATTALVGVRQQASNVVSAALEGERQRALSLADESLSFARGGIATIDRVWAEKQAALGADARQGRDMARRQFDAAARAVTEARRSGGIDRIRDATRSLAAARRLIDAWVTEYSGVRLTLEDRGVPAALVTASRLYFAGEYQSSLNALNDPALIREDAPLRIHVHLFRAAALFTLFVRSGETAENLRAQAATAVALCTELDPGFRPDSRAFGLRFIAFYDSQAGR